LLYYPQLTSGSVSQFPITRRLAMRTIVNQLPGGDNIRVSDPGAATVRWQLQYKNLTNDEFAAMEQLFEASEGRLNTFTFLDPTDNLLMWSEDWTKPVWSAAALLQVTSGFSDPNGGTGAVQITNTAQAAGRVLQTIAGPSWFQYCFSVSLRSDASSAIQLVIAGGQESTTAILTGGNWTRVVKAGSLSSRQDGISFGLELPAGVRIQAFGAQVEAQPAAGYYKKTIDRAGVYSKTRFDTDELGMTTDGPNQNSGAVSLVSGLGEG
jgi:hypothetical protein